MRLAVGDKDPTRRAKVAKSPFCSCSASFHSFAQETAATARICHLAYFKH